MQTTVPTPASIDAALVDATAKYAKEGVRIQPAKAFSATDSNGPRIVVRLIQGSWAASITIEDVDGDNVWYADATMDSIGQKYYTEDDLTMYMETITMVRSVLRTIKRAVGA